MNDIKRCSAARVSFGACRSVGGRPAEMPGDARKRVSCALERDNGVGPRSVVIIVSLGIAGACDFCRMGRALGQQSCQDGYTCLVHADTSGDLCPFRIQSTFFAAGPKDYLEKRLDFPCDFPMNSSTLLFHLRRAGRVGLDREQMADLLVDRRQLGNESWKR
jgi:hypothetical protein